MKNFRYIIIFGIVFTCFFSCKKDGDYSLGMRVSLINDTDDSLTVYLLYSDPGPDLSEQDIIGTYRLLPHDIVDHYLSVRQDEIFQRCDTLHVVFFRFGVDNPYDVSGIIKWMKFTSEDLDSCKRLILYQ